jgi:hypothetical protein
MSLPVGLLIIGMLLSPLTSTVADDLGVHRIGGNALAMIIGTPPPLALRLAADVLLSVELGGLERLLAITAAARQNISSEDRLAAILLRKSKFRN